MRFMHPNCVGLKWLELSSAIHPEAPGEVKTGTFSNTLKKAAGERA
jgi:hypothetical protein